MRDKRNENNYRNIERDSDGYREREREGVRERGRE